MKVGGLVGGFRGGLVILPGFPGMIGLGVPGVPGLGVPGGVPGLGKGTGGSGQGYTYTGGTIILFIQFPLEFVSELPIVIIVPITSIGYVVLVTGRTIGATFSTTFTIVFTTLEIILLKMDNFR